MTNRGIKGVNCHATNNENLGDCGSGAHAVECFETRTTSGRDVIVEAPVRRLREESVFDRHCREFVVREGPAMGGIIRIDTDTYRMIHARDDHCSTRLDNVSKGSDIVSSPDRMSEI